MDLFGMISRMNVSQLQNTTILLVASIFLSSCASMSEGNRIRAEGAGVGSAIGTITGAVACKNNRAACAAGGGVIGGVVGYMIGDQQAGSIHYQGQQNTYREIRINTIREQNTIIADYNNQLRYQVAQYEQAFRRGIDCRVSLLTELKKSQDAHNKLLPFLDKARQDLARMDNPNLRINYEEEVERLEREIKDLDVSIRRLQNISYQRIGG